MSHKAPLGAKDLTKASNTHTNPDRAFAQLARKNEYARKYRALHREEINGWLRSYYQRNKEQAIERAKQWRIDNPERARESERKSASRPEAKEMRVERQRKRRADNREEENRKQREYRRTDKGNAVHRQYLHNRRAKMRNTQSEDMTKLYEKMRGHNLWCYLCWKPIHGSECHIDHIIPLSRGGTHTRDNIAPACPECNQRKSNKI